MLMREVAAAVTGKTRNGFRGDFTSSEAKALRKNTSFPSYVLTKTISMFTS